LFILNKCGVLIWQSTHKSEETGGSEKGVVGNRFLILTLMFWLWITSPLSKLRSEWFMWSFLRGCLSELCFLFL